MKGTDVVMTFAKDHGYNIMVDEESVWWMVFTRQPGKPMGGNFEIPKMLITREIGYKITTTESVRKSRSVLDVAAFQFQKEAKKEEVKATPSSRIIDDLTEFEI